MSSDDYQVQNIFKYARKTHKKNRRTTPENDVVASDNIDSNESPRSDLRGAVVLGPPGCTCEVDTEGEIASILHKKCPVINLAEQQLKRLLSETDKLLCDNTRCCRSIYDFVCICKEIFFNKEKCRLVLLVLIVAGFFLGLLIGGASCGTYLGRFNSPILSCLDSFFIPDTYPSIEDTYHSIV